MRADYVELGRCFLPDQKATDSDEAAWLSYFRSEYTDRRSIDWETLLGPDTRCAVVLGEAGSGKSWEFAMEQQRVGRTGLKPVGCSAFSVRIGHCGSHSCGCGSGGRGCGLR